MPIDPKTTPTPSRKELEEKAKKMVADLNQSGVGQKVPNGGKPPGKPGSGAVIKGGLAAIALALVGAGAYAGVNLLNTPQSAETRQQAAYDIDFTCTQQQSTQNLACLNFPGQVWKDGWCVLNICPDGDTSGDNGCSWDDRNVYWEFGHCWDYVIPKVKMLDPSVCYQFDTVISKTDLRWCDLTNPPSACTGYEANMLSCKPQERPTICDNTTISKNTIGPGESITITAKSKIKVKKFQIGFYNLDNLYGPGNPKGFMPVANQQLVMVKEVPTETLETTFTVNYDDIYKPDLHPDWSGTIPLHFQTNAYFFTDSGKLSAPDPNCVETFTRTEPQPTAPPTPTLTPSPSPTPIPACNNSCTTQAQCPAGLDCVSGNCRNEACDQEIDCTCAPTPTPAMACTAVSFSNNNPDFGQTVTLTCGGTPAARAVFGHFQVSVDSSTFADLPNATNTTAQLTIDKTGHYEIRCRMCNAKDDSGAYSDCSDWQGAAAN